VVLGVSFVALTASGGVVLAVGVVPPSCLGAQLGPRVPQVDHLDLSAFALDGPRAHLEWASSSLAWAVEVENGVSGAHHWPQTLA
jgi:hypothetical protein